MSDILIGQFIEFLHPSVKNLSYIVLLKIGNQLELSMVFRVPEIFLISHLLEVCQVHFLILILH